MSPSLAWARPTAAPAASAAPVALVSPPALNPEMPPLSLLSPLPLPAAREPCTYYRAGNGAVVRTAPGAKATHPVCALCISHGQRPLQANHRHISGHVSCAAHLVSDEWDSLPRRPPAATPRCAVARFNPRDVLPWPGYEAARARLRVGVVYVDERGEYTRQRAKSWAKLCSMCARRGAAVRGRWSDEHDTRLCTLHRAAIGRTGSPSLRVA